MIATVLNLLITFRSVSNPLLIIITQRENSVKAKLQDAGKPESKSSSVSSLITIYLRINPANNIPFNKGSPIFSKIPPKMKEETSKSIIHHIGPGGIKALPLKI